MEFFSSWLRNIVFISVIITLLNLLLSEAMAKYVKVISGFMIMLVIIQPFAQLLKKDTYFETIFLKHSTVMEESVELTTEVDSLKGSQESMTVQIYKDKLKDSIEAKLKESLKLEVDLTLEINENLNQKDFGRIRRANLIILEEENEGEGIRIKPIIIGEKAMGEKGEVNEKTLDEINNFFLNFYNLEAKNISISKNE